MDGEALVSVSKTVSPSPIVSGQPLTYTITILNDPSATGAAIGVALTDMIPVDYSNITFASGNGTCAPASGVAGTFMTCNPIDNIPIGTSTVINILGTAP